MNAALEEKLRLAAIDLKDGVWVELRQEEIYQIYIGRGFTSMGEQGLWASYCIEAVGRDEALEGEKLVLTRLLHLEGQPADRIKKFAERVLEIDRARAELEGEMPF